MTPGVQAAVAQFIRNWHQIVNGHATAEDFADAPELKLPRTEDVEYFKAQMDTALADHLRQLEEQRLAKIAEHDAEIAARNREIEALQARAQAQEAQVITRGDARAKLMQLAKVVAPSVDFGKLSDADIRRAAVRSRMGDAEVQGRSDAYIDARFDILAEDAKKNASADPFASAVRDGVKTVNAASPAGAYEAYCKHLTAAYTKH
ncbi:hypothetical protein BTR14_13130 [Rhizobium rhizosphaerae]|uniref:Uncharacterized protein n=2 Tax=Xaviernesmea rhizosphaerae TaxID=1672749 RepID=A0ABX3PDD9_9HYPH|nr:hypothetical protein BTR14_13130 [Xaviernesmea rhizosphaerae]